MDIILTSPVTLPGVRGTVEGAGVELAYLEEGAGASVVVVHGIAADTESAAALVDGVPGRVIAYDRRGYGASTAPEPYAATTVEEQAEDLGALIAALRAAPALLVGDGFGALAVLDLLKRRGELVRAAVVSNPPLFAFVPAATEELSGQRQLLEGALRDGGPAAAVEAWLGGRVGGAALQRARAAHVAFFADFAGLASWPVTRRELRALDAPLAVVTGPYSPPHIVTAADVLAGLVPGAERRTDGDVAAAARAFAG